MKFKGEQLSFELFQITHMNRIISQELAKSKQENLPKNIILEFLIPLGH